MKISFIIPAYNEEKNIERCLKSITVACEKIPYKYEIIVSNHSSRDDTELIAKRLGARVITVPRGGNVSLVRNKGFECSHGEIIVFLDADIELTEAWSRSFLNYLPDLNCNPLQIIGSLCVPPDSDNYFIANWFKKIIIKNSGYLGTAHLITGRELFNQLNGFNENLITGEDYDFCKRARALDFKISIIPDMIVFHHDYPTTAFDFLKRESWHGEGDFQSLKLFLNSKVALAALVFLIFHILFVIVSSIWTFSYASIFLIGIIALLFLSAFIKFRDLSLLDKVKTLPIFYLYYLGRATSSIRVAIRVVKRYLK